MNRTACLRCTVVAIASLMLSPVASAQSDAELQKIDPPADLVVPPAPVVPAEEAVNTFTLEEGFEIQLVAAEPLVIDPVCMAWDEMGRLWVAEMTGYLPTPDAEGEKDPTGNIVILEDTDGDGRMDQRTVWLDKIVLPRAIAFAKNGVLYADHTTLYFVRMNSDGSPGAKMAIDRDYSNNGGKPTNPEHQANGLLYGLDNWYYNARSNRRYQHIAGRFRRNETEFRGQWGITQDDDGRLLVNRNAVLIQYHAYPPSVTLRNPNYKFRDAPIVTVDHNEVYPIRVTPGVNRAYRPNKIVSHKTWKLIRPTATCGPVIYRGTQFPEEFYGNAFVPEPAGHLVKRIVIGRDEQGKPTAKQAYSGREFLASTDERSRIVNAYTGPDGALYLVDMYRGLIQHTAYLTDYLRRQALSRGLEKPYATGRIYRVVHKQGKANENPTNLAELPSAELVALLSTRNSWQRHTAQRLLVQRRDAESVAPLEKMATEDANAQSRIHALWTLKGMRRLSAETLFAAGASDDPRVRVQVLRLAEDFNEDEAAIRFVALLQRYNNEQAETSEQPYWALDLQLALTGGVFAGIDTPQAYDVLLSVLDRRGEENLFRSAVISGLRGKEAVMLAKVKDGPIKAELTSALVKATENGDLTIGSLLALIDSEDFADSRSDLLKSLAEQAVDQERNEVIDLLIGKLSDGSSTEDNQLAILQGMANARQARSTPIELDGKPELFDSWAAEPPAILEQLGIAIDELFIFERTVISAELKKRIELGQLHYGTHCATCHNDDGSGVEKAAPPLIESEWVQMHPNAIISLILHGVEGDITVNGKLYTSPEDTPGIMPGLKTAIPSDEDLADILTYIRSKDFKNNTEHVGPIDAKTVAEVRKLTSSRPGPYTPAQLMLISNKSFEAEGIAAPVVASAGLVVQPKLELPGWLQDDYVIRKYLILTLIGVLVPLVFLLIATLLGARAKPVEQAH